MLVPQHHLATAFGLMQAIQNLGTALVTMAAGRIVDAFGHFWLMNFFLMFLVLALASTVAIWVADASTSGYINMAPREREKVDGEREARGATGHSYSSISACQNVRNRVTESQETRCV